MSKFKSAVRSLRLRTLPLSLAGVCLGMLLAASDYKVSPIVCVLVMLTTVSLQILSNLSNELGDVLSGTDTEDRVGFMGGLDTGELSIKDMKMLIGGAFAACIAFGLWMIRESYGTLFCLESICLMMLGAAAMAGAMKYTLGRNPYGYRGLGDIFVFIFFGLTSVLGSYFVVAHTIPTFWLLLPACAIGFFSVAVLNVNNIRDMKTDAATRVTVAIKLGLHWARVYQTALIVLGWVCMVAFCLARFFDPWHYIYVVTLPLYVVHLLGVWKHEGSYLDKMLPLLVMATFALALLAGFGFIAFLLFQ